MLEIPKQWIYALFFTYKLKNGLRYQNDKKKKKKKKKKKREKKYKQCSKNSISINIELCWPTRS